MYKYLSKIIFIQFLNLLFPFLFMKLLLKNLDPNFFSETELITSLGAFCFLIIEFSFSIVAVLLLKKKKLSIARINYVNTNIILLRFIIFLITSVFIFIVILLLNISIIKNWFYIFFFIFSSIFDLGWFYVLKNKYHIYFFNSVFLKNFIILIFIYLFIDNIKSYYILFFSLIPLLVNIVLIFVNRLFIKFKYFSPIFIRVITSKGLKLTISDVVIASYSYLDVFFVAFFTDPLSTTKYLIVRKLVKGITSLVGQLPKVILKQKIGESSLLVRRSYLIYIMILLVFFLGFNFFSKILYEYFFKVSDLNLFWVSFLFSFTIFFGPLQNLYLQTKILLVNNSIIYMYSYIFGLFSFVFIITLLYLVGMLNIYSFVLVRVLSDLLIIFFSYFNLKLNESSKKNLFCLLGK